ncbi:MAG: metallophosphoesterase, partial [Planctomycetales bacterium]
MRIAWITDPHLNFVTSTEIDSFFSQLDERDLDVLLIGGDIGESHDVEDFLKQFDDRFDCPIYFVLGNHDFYFGSITEVRSRVSQLCSERTGLTYLSSSRIVELTENVGLIGHDGWADGRVGDYERSMVMMNDYRLIDELASFSKQDRLVELHKLGDEAAGHIRRWLPAALDRYAEVILLTHIPPLREACWHDGQISDDEWAPHFVCQAVGDVLLEIMPAYPNHHLLVLCGHTHGCGETKPLGNLKILTGAATYGKP